MGIGLCVKESGLDEKQLSKQKLRERAGPEEEVRGIGRSRMPVGGCRPLLEFEICHVMSFNFI